MVWRAIEAAESLEREDGVEAEVLNVSIVKPLHPETILESLAKTGVAVTAEEHRVVGGLADAVRQVAAEQHPVPVFAVGMGDEFGVSGTGEACMEHFGLTARGIADRAREALLAEADRLAPAAVRPRVDLDAARASPRWPSASRAVADDRADVRLLSTRARGRWRSCARTGSRTRRTATTGSRRRWSDAGYRRRPRLGFAATTPDTIVEGRPYDMLTIGHDPIRLLDALGERDGRAHGRPRLGRVHVLGRPPRTSRRGCARIVPIALPNCEPSPATRV